MGEFMVLDKLTKYVETSGGRWLDILTVYVKTNLMNEAGQGKVLDAAMELFIRHGFKRTTMGDIAAGAEMSRPAVYLVYRNKEQIFRGVVTKYAEEAELRAARRVAAKEGLAAQLAAVLKTWVVEPYQLISRSPEAEELHAIGFSFAADLREQMTETFERQLREVMEASPEVDGNWLRKQDLDVGLIARLIARSTPELKRTVKSLAELERLLATVLRINVLVLTGASPG